MLSSRPRANWCFKPFDDLLKEAAKISDRDERTRLYRKAQAIFKGQAPWMTNATKKRKPCTRMTFAPSIPHLPGVKD